MHFSLDSLSYFTSYIVYIYCSVFVFQRDHKLVLRVCNFIAAFTKIAQMFNPF